MDRQGEESNILGDTMKIIKILIVLLLTSNIGCNDSLNIDRNLEISDLSQLKEDTKQMDSTFLVKGFSLALKNIDGNCVLSYRKGQVESNNMQGNIQLDIAAPCEFVRKPGAIEEPSFRTYGTKSKVTVGIVTGGRPHPRFADIFQPQGCGTEIQKILIYEDKIAFDKPLKSLEVVCPSEGLEEVFFAA